MRWSFLSLLRKSLSARILTGLACGVFAGLFVGESAKALQPLADIYVRLMQMTVLPYLVTALIIAFGQLSADQAKRLAARGGLLLVVVWLVTSVVLVLVPTVFPAFETATFFSTSLVEPARPFAFTDIYFTSNLFDSLSRNVVPAVVLFSCLLGVALIGLADKERLIAPLMVWNAAIVRITKFVIELTPIGVFAIGAVAAGTLTLETLTRLEVYLIAFCGASLLLALWVLPLLVTAVTPFRYGEVASIARDALLTAFVTSSAFIVLPLLVERSKALLAQHGQLNEQTDSAAELLAPVLFNFPNAGKLMTLLFVPFAAWLNGAPLTGRNYATLLFAGIPSYFAKAQVALPFLLDLFELPQDIFQLYIPTTILTGKFDSLVTAVNLLAFALVGAAAMGGFLVFERGRLLRAGFGIVAGTLVVIGLLRVVLAATVDTGYRLSEQVQHMQKMQRTEGTVVRAEGVKALHHREPLDGLPSLERIRTRGVLRVGYDPNNLPFSFFNRDGDLVGFDVELSEALATALHVKAEFVPIRWSDLPRLLAEGAIDIMPGMWYRPNWFGRLHLSRPYLVGTMGLVVRDERRHEFARVDDLRKPRGLKIGVPLDVTQNEASMRYYFAGSDAQFVVVEFWQPFFEGKHPEIDAFLMPAEHATGWTLLHPEYSVVVPQPDPIRISTGFGVAPGARDLADIVDEWVEFARDTRLIDRVYDYWVLGRGAESKVPRWSIMRNVLGWQR